MNRSRNAPVEEETKSSYVKLPGDAPLPTMGKRKSVFQTLFGGNNSSGAEQKLTRREVPVVGSPNSAQAFLDSVTHTVDTRQLYEIEQIFYMQEGVFQANDYACLVLRIIDPQLVEFFGGTFLVQIWKNEQRLYQHVHNSRVHPNIFLSQTELAYMLERDENKFVYLVHPFKKIYSRIKSPFETIVNLHLFVNDEILVLAQDRNIKAVRLVDLVQRETTSYYAEVEEQPFAINSEFKLTMSMSRDRSNAAHDFKSAFSPQTKFAPKQSVQEIFKQDSSSFYAKKDKKKTNFVDNIEKYETRSISFMCEEVYKDQKIIGLVNDTSGTFGIGVVSTSRESIIYQSLEFENLFAIKLSAIITQEKSKCHRDDRYASVKVRRVSQTYLLIALLSEKGYCDLYCNKMQPLATSREFIDFRSTGSADVSSQKQDFSRCSDLYIGTEALYFTLVDSQAVYRVEIDHFSQKIDLNKGEPCESMVLGILNERFMKKHLKIFQDVKILCGVVLFAHGNVLSVFDFARDAWTHHIFKGDDQSNSSMFFGYRENEIQSVSFLNLNCSQVYEVLVDTISNRLKKLVYFSDGVGKNAQPVLIEQKMQSKLSFEGHKISNITLQVDSVDFREFGETDIATFFQARDTMSKANKTDSVVSDIYMANSYSQVIQVCNDINPFLELLPVRNCPTTLLFMANTQRNSLDCYDISNQSAVIEQDEIERRLFQRIPNFTHRPGTQYFKDENFFYYEARGNLVRIDLQNGIKETIDFDNSIQNLMVLQGNSVYFKSNDSFFFVDLDWLATNQVQAAKFKQQLKQMPIFQGQSILYDNFEFDVIGNKIACFVDPFQLKVFPPLNYNSLDCLGSFSFNRNFIAHTEQERDTEFCNTVSALNSERGLIYSWQQGTGKLIKQIEVNKEDFADFKFHSVWQGWTIIVKRQSGNAEGQEQKAIFKKIQVQPYGVLVACTIKHPYVRGRKVFISSDNLRLIEFFDDKYSFYTIRDNGTTLGSTQKDEKNTFSTVMHPAYFSPDFSRYLVQTKNKLKLFSFEKESGNGRLIGNEREETNHFLPFRELLCCKSRQQNPLISLVSNDTVAYINTNNVLITAPFLKSPAENQFSISETFLPPKMLQRAIELHNLNFSDKFVRSLQYLDALQLKMAVFKLFNEKSGIHFQGPETPFGCFEVSVTNTLRITTSFSHFHWMLIECFENGILGLKDVQMTILHELLEIILPNGDTFLHRLLLKNLPLFEQLMEVIIADNKKPNSLFVVHLIPNAQGKTALHICVEKSYSRAASSILKIIGTYPLGDHIHFIVDILKDLLLLCPVSVANYFEMRVIKPSWAMSQTQGELQKTDDSCEFGLASLPMNLQDKAAVNKALFVIKSNGDSRMSDAEFNQDLSVNASQSLVQKRDLDQIVEDKLEQESGMNMPMTQEILDFPSLHFFHCPFNKEFLEVLAGQQDVEMLYQTKFVRALLEYQLPPIKSAVIKWQLIPYLLYLILFIVYAVYFFEQHIDVTPDDVQQTACYYASQGLLFLFTFYFLGNVLKRLGNTKITQFLSSVWNIIDVIPLLLVTTSLCFTFLESTPERLIWQRYLNSISAFLLWMKLFYFFRVFRNFSFMIKTMVTVFQDMSVFLVLLTCMLSAFAGTFLILSNNQAPADQYLTNYTSGLQMMFEWALGNQDSSSFGSVGFGYQYFFYMLACLSLIVTMLNLLISIIGDSFGRVTSAALTGMYMEFNQLIIENQVLLPKSFLNSDTEKSGRFLCVNTLEGNLIAALEADVFSQLRNEVMTKVAELQRQVEERNAAMETVLAQNKARIEQLQTLILATTQNDLQQGKEGDLKESLASLQLQVETLAKRQ